MDKELHRCRFRKGVLSIFVLFYFSFSCSTWCLFCWISVCMQTYHCVCFSLCDRPGEDSGKKYQSNKKMLPATTPTIKKEKKET